MYMYIVHRILYVYTHMLLNRPLQRMVIGMVIAGLSFMAAGFVQISVQSADTALSNGHAKVGLPQYCTTLPSDIFNLSLSLSLSLTLSDCAHQFQSRHTQCQII